MDGKRSLKNLIWEGLGLCLGGVLSALGRLLAAPERFLVTFLTFKINMFYNIAPRAAQEAFFFDFNRFGMDFRRLWG